MVPLPNAYALQTCTPYAALPSQRSSLIQNVVKSQVLRQQLRLLQKDDSTEVIRSVIRIYKFEMNNRRENSYEENAHTSIQGITVLFDNLAT